MTNTTARTWPTQRRFVLIAAAMALLGASLAACSGTGNQAPTPTARLTDPPQASASGAPSSTAPPAAASPSGDSSVVSACSLITEQEASTALGTDPGPGAADSQGIATSCAFGTPPYVVTINLVPGGGKAAYEHALGIAKARQLVTISGVGDGAFGEFKGSFATIEFYKGDALVNVVLGVKGATAPPQDQTMVLAQLAAGRL